ncbi:MAG: chromosomal replication initiator protein DnaA [Patescibacteria group bacterium]|nr:chromosomal replication initiator protein DnaA [Patescibacteria group bacterium]
MNSPELNELWEKTLGEIEIEVSKANFLTLFKNTSLLSLEKNIASVAAPSTMIIDLLKKRFHDLIQKTLEKHAGEKMDLIFVPKTMPSKKEDTGPLFIEQEEKRKITIGHLPRVRQEYTFQNMAVSSSNQLAYISAQTVSQKIGTIYNPLFIYGPVGVGKTHLMQAIANHVYQKDPAKKIIYTTSEEFTNEVVEAIRTNNTAQMKQRFRSVYLLLIDDVQFIAGKDRVQEELFHTFNILIDNSAQVVLSSDRPPQEIKKLEKRLSSRFAGGLTVDIETPDFELKTAILLIKAKKYDIDLSVEIAKIIAEKVQDVRSLEGTLLRILTEAKTLGTEITEDLAKKTLSGRGEEKKEHIHPEDIIKNVCVFYNIKSTQIKGPKRDASLAKARQVAMYLLKKELNLSLVEIGNILGGRDHTTIMYGVEKIENNLSTKTQIYSEIMGITKNLRE